MAISALQFARDGLTVCVTCVWAGVDSAWEQEKLEARKMLVNRAESHTSGARFVGTLLTFEDSLPLKDFAILLLTSGLSRFAASMRSTNFHFLTDGEA